eukprot:3111538-Pyramimonas_sp.AAC.1
MSPCGAPARGRRAPAEHCQKAWHHMTSADETRCGAPMVGRRSRAQAHRYRLRRRHFRIGVATGFPPGI